MNAYLIVKPVITEKTLQLAGKTAYTFQVARTATKSQIKEAIQSLYGVNVLSVNTIMGHKATQATGKKRLQRQVPKVKKAVVTLKAGQKIELFDIPGATA